MPRCCDNIGVDKACVPRCCDNIGVDKACVPRCNDNIGVDKACAPRCNDNIGAIKACPPRCNACIYVSSARPRRIRVPLPDDETRRPPSNRRFGVNEAFSLPSADNRGPGRAAGSSRFLADIVGEAIHTRRGFFWNRRALLSIGERKVARELLRGKKTKRRSRTKQKCRSASGVEPRWDSRATLRLFFGW